MAETNPSGRPGERPNPSVESTRRDDEHDRTVHENQEALGAAAGAGLGCLGITLAPWVIIAAGIGVAIVIAFLVKTFGR
jgi:hypothetical protein